MPRIAPVSDKSQVAPEHQHVVDAVLEVFGGLRGPHSILLHSPEAEFLLFKIHGERVGVTKGIFICLTPY